MRMFWFAVSIILILGVMTGLYWPTGNFVANLPPDFDYPTSDFDGDSLQLDLNKAFFDPDGDVLSYSVETDDSVAAGIKGTTLIASGQGTIFVTASDGAHKVVQRIVIRG